MERPKSSIFSRKAFIVLVVCLSIPLLATWYIVQYLNSDIFYAQKGESLTAVAWMLDTQMGAGGYDEILRDADAGEATREEKIDILNAALRDVTDVVASVGEGLGVGFYSRELDAILTYGPSESFQENVGKSIAADHPGRQVMATGEPMVQMGTMVRGNIMNAMVPVVRGGEVIGYIWANELMSELETMLNRTTGLISILLLLVYVLMVVTVGVFFRRVIRAEERARETVESSSREIRRVDGLMHVVNQAVSSLLTADEAGFEAALQNSMEMMADAFEVDRLIIWKRTVGDHDPGFRLAARYADEAGRAHGFIDFAEGEPPAAAGWPDWLARLSANEIVTFFRSWMSTDGAAWLDAHGIQSITTVPVFLQDNFWGFVSFSNCHTERAFTKDEEAILFSGSLLMANAIARNELMHRLVTAREEALAGTRAKSAFLASMSHEMRTPMNAIIGMANIGRTATDIERKDYALGRIADASLHLLGVINDVLDISKIESGKLDLSPVEFVLEEMLQRVTGVMDGRLLEKEQSFLVRIDDAIPETLVCDDQRLAQVITNLLSNAVKFTPQGGAVILDTRLLAEEGDICTLQIDVTDNGIGMSEEQQRRVFNAFEQAENSTTRKYGGTGLGLSISRNLVELMGGRLWVRSAEGEGSTFSLTVTAPRGSARGGVRLPDGTDWGQYRLLIVDDDAPARAYFATLAQRLGLRCDTAGDGEEALALLHGRDYDLCFVDWRMPDMDGLALAERIGQAHPGQRIALMASALEWDGLREAAVRAGIGQFLPKPVFPKALAASVEGCLGDGQQADQSLLPEDAQAVDDFTGRKILLAEDVDINGEILITLLEPTGVTIDWARDGAQAVRMFRDAGGRYDMIFMDVQMPEMDGHEATRTIREMDVPGAATVPIVAMTANVFKEDIEACRASGMDDHVGKPMDMADVMAKLRRYLA